MKKPYMAGLLVCFILLSACTPRTGGEERSQRTVAATTWPVYCFATAVAEGVEGMKVVPVINQPMSCLHDYTLSVTDMKTLEGANLILKSGVGLESFMDAAVNASGTPVVDCAEGVELRHLDEDEAEHNHEAEEDEHEHGEFDPHIWMDPSRAGEMVENIARVLAGEDPEHAEQYRANADKARAELTTLAEQGKEKLSGLSNRGLITFHDGFGYFAQAFDLYILKAIEEEEGSETSAKGFQELTELIKLGQVPAIFVEVNGSDATAKALSRETGVQVATLSMIMSGEGSGMKPYLDVMNQNIDTILEALG